MTWLVAAAATAAPITFKTPIPVTLQSPLPTVPVKFTGVDYGYYGLIVSLVTLGVVVLQLAFLWIELRELTRRPKFKPHFYASKNHQAAQGEPFSTFTIMAEIANVGNRAAQHFKLELLVPIEAYAAADMEPDVTVGHQGYRLAPPEFGQTLFPDRHSLVRGQVTAGNFRADCPGVKCLWRIYDFDTNAYPRRGYGKVYIPFT